jgi:Mrp family chromosome partitioning ATPase
MDDDGSAISYKLLEPGTPVYAADGGELGKVRQVLEAEREHIFDGIVIDTPSGQRFVDAPEVARIAERAVTLSIDAAEAAALPAPEKTAPTYSANVKAGRVGRFFGGGWKRN